MEKCNMCIGVIYKDGSKSEIHINIDCDVKVTLRCNGSVYEHELHEAVDETILMDIETAMLKGDNFSIRWNNPVDGTVRSHTFVASEIRRVYAGSMC